MKNREAINLSPKFWASLGFILIFLASLGLRFWNLGQFNKLVFDEVYYAKFANDYLRGEPFFQSHPPLSQYLIALGIWLGSQFPSSPDLVNNLTGSLRSTISYRWLNALTGSFIPLIVGAIAYQLTRRYRYGVIAALLAACDGLFLVESRYALNNIYLVVFGLLGQFFFLWAINQKKFLYFTLSGCFFGASATIKWNGLGFLLAIFLCLGIAYISHFMQKLTQSHWSVLTNNHTLKTKILGINPLFYLVNYTLIPLIVYRLLWIPHLMMNPRDSFWELHRKIWEFHHNIGNTPDVHPYCSSWYSWLIMWRPIAYLYQTQNSEKGTIIYDVHAMGNPLLWWLSLGAMIWIFIRLILAVLNKIRVPKQGIWIMIYLLINYIANLLPWISVTRCTFLYHYMASYVFTWLALAWLIDSGLQSQHRHYQRFSVVAIILIIAAFLYWLPVYLGIPLSQQEFNLRMWFPNWI